MSAPAPESRPPLVPPHVAWPAFVVFLLAISISMATVTVIAANSDGGARVIEAASDTASADSVRAGR